MIKEIISYESCKWYIKLWRKRWYIYASYLYIKCYINIEYLIEYLIYKKLNSEQSKKLKKSWNEIKTSVELSKMYKFSSKIERYD